MDQVQLMKNGDGKSGVNTQKLAMSKALGQAFLSHQVTRLEEDAGGRGRNSNRRGSSRAHSDINNRARNTVPKRNMTNTAIDDQSAQPISKPPSKVVLDASVLIHALDQVRKWCTAENEIKIIIPLEGMDS